MDLSCSDPIRRDRNFSSEAGAIATTNSDCLRLPAGIEKSRDLLTFLPLGDCWASCSDNLPGQRLKVITHDSQHDGSVKGMAVAGSGFKEEFPVAGAGLPQYPLLQDGAGQGNVVRKRATCMVRRMVLSQKSSNTIIICVRVIDALKN